MAFVLERDPPCEKCPSCLLAVEARKMLEFVDKRYLPMLEAAAKQVSEARWRRSDEALKRARRAYDQRLEDYLNQRAKILAPDVVTHMWCPVAGVRVIGAPDIPEPAEISVRPREREDAPDPGRPRCAGCGAITEDGLILPHLTVCPQCFGGS